MEIVVIKKNTSNLAFQILKEITDPTETNLTLAPRTVSSSESVETPTAEEFLEFNKHTDAVKLEPDLKDSVTKVGHNPFFSVRQSPYGPKMTQCLMLMVDKDFGTSAN